MIISETFSDNFKKLFLIKLTEQLIIHSEEIELRKLQGIIESKEKEKFIPKKKIEKPEIKTEPGVFAAASEKIPVRPVKKAVMVREISKPSLLIPEPKLPQHLEYLRPMPTAGIEIDLWKLNPVIKDPAVRVIEVNPDEKVLVTGTMGTKATGIILNKEDINRVINEFSKTSKIPVEEGVYRVVVGNLILSAVISEVVGSKFILRKMAAVPPKPQYAAGMPRMPNKFIRR